MKLELEIISDTSLDILDIILRITLALILGGILGYEREYKRKNAGLVTNTLVCLGACSIALTQSLIAEKIDGLDPTRLIAQIVSGVGFLGAGAILHEKGSVKGITTAATIWTVSAIGISIGMGFYFVAVTTTFATMVALKLFKNIEINLKRKRIKTTYHIKYVANSGFRDSLKENLEKKGIYILNFKDLKKHEKNRVEEITAFDELEVQLTSVNGIDLGELKTHLETLKGVYEIKVRH